jgi:predicted RNase H-like nuclease (RuvC/YqgF family)
MAVHEREATRRACGGVETNTLPRSSRSTETRAPRLQLSQGTLDELTERSEPYLYWMKSNSPSREEMREEFERMLTALRARLEQIERRFPEEAAIDKYASVNEAVLDTKIEQLQKSIENLESRILTKWDVATVVFALFSAIGVVAGTIFAVANFVLK